MWTRACRSFRELATLLYKKAPEEAVERFLATEFWTLSKNKKGEDVWPQMFDAACKP